MLLKTSVLHFNNSRFSKIPSSIVFQSGVFGTGLFLENCEFFDFPGSTPLFELNPLNGSSFHLNIVDSTFHDIESKGDSLIGLRNRDLLASSVYIDNCTFVKVQFFRSGILYFNPELASKMMDFSLVFKNCLFDDVSATMSSSLHSILLSVNFQFRGRLSILFDSCTIQNIRGTTEGTTVMVWAIASSVVVRNTTITNAEVDTLFLLNGPYFEMRDSHISNSTCSSAVTDLNVTLYAEPSHFLVSNSVFEHLGHSHSLFNFVCNIQGSTLSAYFDRVTVRDVNNPNHFILQEGSTNPSGAAFMLTNCLFSDVVDLYDDGIQLYSYAQAYLANITFQNISFDPVNSRHLLTLPVTNTYMPHTTVWNMTVTGVTLQRGGVLSLGGWARLSGLNITSSVKIADAGAFVDARRGNVMILSSNITGDGPGTVPAFNLSSAESYLGVMGVSTTDSTAALCHPESRWWGSCSKPFETPCTYGAMPRLLVDTFAVSYPLGTQYEAACSSGSVLVGSSNFTATVDPLELPYCQRPHSTFSAYDVQISPGRTYPLFSILFNVTGVESLEPYFVLAGPSSPLPPPGTGLTHAFFTPAGDPASGFRVIPATRSLLTSTFLNITIPATVPGLDPSSAVLAVCRSVPYHNIIHGCSTPFPYPMYQAPAIRSVHTTPASVQGHLPLFSPINFTLTLTPFSSATVFSISICPYEMCPSSTELDSSIPTVDHTANTVAVSLTLDETYLHRSLYICVNSSETVTIAGQPQPRVFTAPSLSCAKLGLFYSSSLSYLPTRLANLSQPSLTLTAFPASLIEQDHLRSIMKQGFCYGLLLKVCYEGDCSFTASFMRTDSCVRGRFVLSSTLYELPVFFVNVTLPKSLVLSSVPDKSVNVSVSITQGLDWSPVLSLSHVDMTVNTSTIQPRALLGYGPTPPSSSSLIRFHGQGFVIPGHTPSCFFVGTLSGRGSGITVVLNMFAKAYNDTVVQCPIPFEQSRSVVGNSFVFMGVSPNGGVDVITSPETQNVWVTYPPYISAVAETGVTEPSTILNVFGAHLYNNTHFACGFVPLDSSNVVINAASIIYGTARFYTASYMQCTTNPLIAKGSYLLTVSNNGEDFRIPNTGEEANDALVLKFTSAPALIRFTAAPRALVAGRFLSASVEVLSNEAEVVAQTFHVAIAVVYSGAGGETLTHILTERSVAKGSGEIRDIVLAVGGDGVGLETAQLRAEVVSESGIQPAMTDPIALVECENVREHSLLFEHICRCGPGYAPANPIDILSECLPCAAGWFKNSTGDGACAPCPSPTLTPNRATAATHCVCAETMVPRAWSKPGVLAECTCTAGHSQNAQGLCSPCAFGTYKPSSGLAACTSCPPFFRTLAIGAANYSECVCASGFVAVEDANHTLTDCVCPLGSQLSDAVTMACSPCGVGSYRSNLTTPLCLACPDPTRTPSAGAISRLDCLCNPGYYRYEAEGDCLPCPACGWCPNGQRPEAAADCFEVAPENYVACPVSGACVGGPESLCADGYDGTMCGDCVSGYYRSRGGECVECGPQSAWLLPALGIFFLVLLFLFYCFNYRPVPQDQMGALRIGFNFLQITALYAEFSIAWPSPLAQILDLSGLVNLSLDLAAPECSLGAQISFILRLYIMLALPLAVVLILSLYCGLCLLLSKAIALFTAKHPAAPASQEASTTPFVQLFRDLAHPPPHHRTFHYRALLRALAMVFLFLYVPVSKICLEYFHCSSGGVASEPSLTCWEGSHLRHLPTALVGLGVVAVGLPLSVFFLARQFRARATRSESVFTILSFLCLRYNRHAYYYEALILFRKLSIVIALVLLSAYPAFQAFIAVFFLFLALVAQSSLQPYARLNLNILDSFSTAVNVFTLLVGNVYLASGSSGVFRTMITFLVVAAIIFNILVILLMLVFESQAYRRSARLNKLQRQESERITHSASSNFDEFMVEGEEVEMGEIGEEGREGRCERKKKKKGVFLRGNAAEEEWEDEVGFSDDFFGVGNANGFETIPSTGGDTVFHSTVAVEGSDVSAYA